MWFLQAIILSLKSSKTEIWPWPRGSARATFPKHKRCTSWVGSLSSSGCSLHAKTAGDCQVAFRLQALPCKALVRASFCYSTCHTWARSAEEKVDTVKLKQQKYRWENGKCWNFSLFCKVLIDSLGQRGSRINSRFPSTGLGQLLFVCFFQTFCSVKKNAEVRMRWNVMQNREGDRETVCILPSTSTLFICICILKNKDKKWSNGAAKAKGCPGCSDSRGRL